MKTLAASRPSATTDSVGAIAPCSLMSVQELSVASASTIMIATSSSTMRPATTIEKTASSSWAKVGKATHWPPPCASGMSAMRTPPIGPEKGRPEIWVEAEAPLMPTTS